jgi:hypothetical protein
MFKHGRRSIEAIERRKQLTAEMRKIQRGMRELVPIDPPGMPGTACGRSAPTDDVEAGCSVPDI